MADSAVNKKR